MVDYNYLNTLLMNEFADVITYSNLSKESEGVESQIFRDIAREEFVHSKHLKRVLSDKKELMDGFEKAEKDALEALDSI